MRVRGKAFGSYATGNQATAIMQRTGGLFAVILAVGTVSVLGVFQWRDYAIANRA